MAQQYQIESRAMVEAQQMHCKKLIILKNKIELTTDMRFFIFIKLQIFGNKYMNKLYYLNAWLKVANKTKK